MAFQPPNAQRELANRKLLEELQLKKQLLLKQGVASTLSPSTLNTPTLSNNNPTSTTATINQTDGHSVTSAQQRSALQQAHAQSAGYFITQDSLFGNLILPVLPRFDSPKP